MKRKKKIEEMGTNLKGRLKNTMLPKNKAIFSLFEAVVNSIHSIDERINSCNDFTIEDAKIVVILNRELSLNIDSDRSLEDICGFTITDNGIGFNKENYKSFKTFDSEYKASLGCRGVGRLTWLKVFNKSHVDSRYMENGSIKELNFDFLPQTGISNISETSGNISEELQTTITLSDVNPDYYKTLPKSAETIAKQLLEHCIWYFLRDGGAPDIIIRDDGDSSVEISLIDVYDNYMASSSKRDTFKIYDVEFFITHVFVRSGTNSEHTLSFCAADRTVLDEPLTNKIVGLFGPIEIDNESYAYKGYVTSDFLSESVTPERTSFNISAFPSEITKGVEITMQEIKQEALAKVKSFLYKYLEENIIEGKERLCSFIANKAPRYQILQSKLSEEELVVNPRISDKDLDLKLYGYLSTLERELMAEGHDLMVPGNIEEKEDYSQRISGYMEKAIELKRSDLANYVAHRRVIIDLLEKAIQVTKSGKFNREDVIHKLIIPMICESTELRSEDTNLWLINESLAFHDFFASDKPLCSMASIECNSNKEPDILSLTLFDNPLLVGEQTGYQTMGSVTIIEFKKPMRNDFIENVETKDPIAQALGYLNRVREGQAQKNGRPIILAENVPGFCYIIGDLTPHMINCAKMKDLKLTHDRLGYFGYNSNFNAYIEVISFDKLIITAKQRNRAFFDKLGLPTN